MIVNLFLLLELQAQDQLGTLTYDQLSEAEAVIAGTETAFKAMCVEEAIYTMYDRNDRIQKTVSLTVPKLESLHTSLTNMLTVQYGCAD
ncbi:hypothetical protein FAES_2271 [Fibrella aestuarina BUZ 2]|uniref:Uncharacterized protein n=1 Tax=Fibrella aestuarina BUZ 2 TaxID=1166018 RepID=I0K827_9BACT|nr:hypothetical protein [Fibrella aestuarina]CCH00280.1 hypothetical protein FAES_2271 [Fibrella aestuarina BUZ 2]